MKEKEGKQIFLQREQRITPEKQRGGFDSTVLIALCSKKQYYNFLRPHLRNVNDLFAHQVSLNMEVKPRLVAQYGFTEKEAKKELNKVVKNFNIQPVGYIEGRPTSKDVLDMAKLKGIKNIKSPDSIILSNFKKFGITTVFSIDNAFIEVAKLLGFRTRLLPAEDIVERKLTARQMRQIDAFFKQYKFKPFRRK